MLLDSIVAELEIAAAAVIQADTTKSPSFNAEKKVREDFNASDMLLVMLLFLDLELPQLYEPEVITPFNCFPGKKNIFSHSFICVVCWPCLQHPFQ